MFNYFPLQYDYIVEQLLQKPRDSYYTNCALITDISEFYS